MQSDAAAKKDASDDDDAAPPSLPAYVHKPSFRTKERHLRDLQRKAVTATKPPARPVQPRNPRYMRPSTSSSKIRRRIMVRGLPLGSSVSSIEAYHDRYCQSLDTSTSEGQLRFANANSRYAKIFWPRVPKLLDEVQRRHERRHQAFAHSKNNTLHKYMLVKPVPQTREELQQTHLREMQRLYDEVVVMPQAGGEGGAAAAAAAAAAAHRDSEYGRCSTCGTETIRYRFAHTCPTCHRSTEAISSNDRNFKEYECCEVRGVATYKRINHFNEWLLRSQGLEQRAVPPQVLEAVRHALTLTGRKLTPQTPPKALYMSVRNALITSRYQDYFEHVPQIIHKVIGLQPPRLTPDELHMVRGVFHAIQAPFERHKPPKRRNFLSYAYVIYKICELLEIDRLLPFCPLFKSIQNQRNADLIWKKICNELNYEFIPTV